VTVKPSAQMVLMKVMLTAASEHLCTRLYRHKDCSCRRSRHYHIRIDLFGSRTFDHYRKSIS
jgi:hypothetical protein